MGKTRTAALVFGALFFGALALLVTNSAIARTQSDSGLEGEPQDESAVDKDKEQDKVGKDDPEKKKKDNEDDEESIEKKAEELKKLLLPTPGPGEGGGENKLLELINELESTLTQVEEMLFEATPQGSGVLQEEILENLDKLLDDAGKGQAKVLASIDELIKNAPRSSQSSSSSSGDPQQKKQQQSQQQQQREQEQKREHAKQQEEQKGKSGKENNSQQEKQQGQKLGGDKKPDDKTGKPNAKPDLVDRWGSLPPMLKDRISKREFTNFPPAYREKLMKYYKRLNDDDR